MKRAKYTPDFKEEAVKQVINNVGWVLGPIECKSNFLLKVSGNVELSKAFKVTKALSK